MIVTVSGTTYYEAMDPLITGVPDECGWPRAEWRRIGKGAQGRYDVTPEQAADILDHLDTLAAVFCGGQVDPETRIGGRAIARDADRLRKQLEDQQ